MGELLPFRTSNFILVHSLHVAGIPWADPTRPCENIYNDDILKNLGFSTPEEAFSAGVKGEVFYAFERVPQLEVALKAFDMAQNALKNAGDGDAGIQVSASIEEVITIACVVLKSRKQILNLWQQSLHMNIMHTGGTVTKSKTSKGGNKIKISNRKIYSLNACEETRNRLKV